MTVLPARYSLAELQARTRAIILDEKRRDVPNRYRAVTLLPLTDGSGIEAVVPQRDAIAERARSRFAVVRTTSTAGAPVPLTRQSDTRLIPRPFMAERGSRSYARLTVHSNNVRAGSVWPGMECRHFFSRPRTAVPHPIQSITGWAYPSAALRARSGHSRAATQCSSMCRSMVAASMTAHGTTRPTPPIQSSAARTTTPTTRSAPPAHSAESAAGSW